MENIYLSVDPYMRQLMDDGWPLNAPLGRGRTIGRVVASRTDELPEGAYVFHNGGWSSHATVAAGQPGVRVFEPADGIPLSNYLSALGGTGLTAYVGIRAELDVQPGEAVYVSSAAGGVGAVAGQIARILGAGRVINSTGSAAKVDHVLGELRFDAAFDYHEGPVSQLLAQAAPDGMARPANSAASPGSARSPPTTTAPARSLCQATSMPVVKIVGVEKGSLRPRNHPDNLHDPEPGPPGTAVKIVGVRACHVGQGEYLSEDDSFRRQDGGMNSQRLLGSWSGA